MNPRFWRALLVGLLVLALPLKAALAVGMLACGGHAAVMPAVQMDDAVASPAHLHGMHEHPHEHTQEHTQEQMQGHVHDAADAAADPATHAAPDCSHCAPCCGGGLPAAMPVLPGPSWVAASLYAPTTAPRLSAEQPVLDRPPRHTAA